MVSVSKPFGKPFGKGLEEYGKDIEQLCVDIRSLFKYSAARREDYHTLQSAMGVEMHNFQKHTKVRCLVWVLLCEEFWSSGIASAAL